MAQMTMNKQASPSGRFAALRQQVRGAVKWWAEHQAWPATDEIRIERRRSTCTN